MANVSGGTANVSSGVDEACSSTNSSGSVAGGSVATGSDATSSTASQHRAMQSGPGGGQPGLHAPTPRPLRKSASMELPFRVMTLEEEGEEGMDEDGWAQGQSQGGDDEEDEPSSLRPLATPRSRAPPPTPWKAEGEDGRRNRSRPGGVGRGRGVAGGGDGGGRGVPGPGPGLGPGRARGRAGPVPVKLTGAGPALHHQLQRRVNPESQQNLRSHLRLTRARSGLPQIRLDIGAVHGDDEAGGGGGDAQDRRRVALGPRRDEQQLTQPAQRVGGEDVMGAGGRGDDDDGLPAQDPSDMMTEDEEAMEMGGRRDKFAYFERVCSRVLEHLYVGSDAVARCKETLRQSGITHVLNCVGYVCPEYFPGEFHYRTLWLQDNTSEDITSVLYDVIDYVEHVRERKGRVYVHCCQGVSRSTSLVIAYLMWWQQLGFEDAFRKVKAIRGVTSPNMGFACQLLQWQKRILAPCSAPRPQDAGGADEDAADDPSAPGTAAPAPLAAAPLGARINAKADAALGDARAMSPETPVRPGAAGDEVTGASRVGGEMGSPAAPASSGLGQEVVVLRLHRMVPHSQYDPLHLVPKLVPRVSVESLDPRGAFLIQVGRVVYRWQGRRCHTTMGQQADKVARQLVRYERLAQVEEVDEGREPLRLCAALEERRIRRSSSGDWTAVLDVGGKGEEGGCGRSGGLQAMDYEEEVPAASGLAEGPTGKHMQPKGSRVVPAASSFSVWLPAGQDGAAAGRQQPPELLGASLSSLSSSASPALSSPGGVHATGAGLSAAVQAAEYGQPLLSTAAVGKGRGGSGGREDVGRASMSISPGVAMSPPSFRVGDGKSGGSARSPTSVPGRLSQSSTSSPSGSMSTSSRVSVDFDSSSSSGSVLSAGAPTQDVPGKEAASQAPCRPSEYAQTSACQHLQLGESAGCGGRGAVCEGVWSGWVLEERREYDADFDTFERGLAGLPPLPFAGPLTASTSATVPNRILPHEGRSWQELAAREDAAAAAAAGTAAPAASPAATAASRERAREEGSPMEMTQAVLVGLDNGQEASRAQVGVKQGSTESKVQNPQPSTGRTVRPGVRRDAAGAAAAAAPPRPGGVSAPLNASAPASKRAPSPSRSGAGLPPVPPQLPQQQQQQQQEEAQEPGRTARAAASPLQLPHGGSANPALGPNSPAMSAPSPSSFSPRSLWAFPPSGAGAYGDALPGASRSRVKGGSSLGPKGPATAAAAPAAPRAGLAAAEQAVQPGSSLKGDEVKAEGRRVSGASTASGSSSEGDGSSRSSRRSSESSSSSASDPLRRHGGASSSEESSSSSGGEAGRGAGSLNSPWLTSPGGPRVNRPRAPWEEDEGSDNSSMSNAPSGGIAVARQAEGKRGMRAGGTGASPQRLRDGVAPKPPLTQRAPRSSGVAGLAVPPLPPPARGVYPGKGPGDGSSGEGAGDFEDGASRGKAGWGSELPVGGEDFAFVPDVGAVVGDEDGDMMMDSDGDDEPGMLVPSTPRSARFAQRGGGFR